MLPELQVTRSSDTCSTDNSYAIQTSFINLKLKTMKKNLLLHLSLITSLTLLLCNAHAQKNLQKNDFRGSKFMLPPAERTIITTLDGLKELSARAFKNFTRTVKNPSDLRITENEEGIHIYCQVDNIANRIGYTKRGNWQYTMRFYTEEHLPKDVRHHVRSTYYDFNISGVVEVRVGDKIGYVVTLEDKTSWKKVKVVDNEMELMGEWTKSK